jgi:hypothetical protein
MFNQKNNVSPCGFKGLFITILNYCKQSLKHFYFTSRQISFMSNIINHHVIALNALCNRFHQLYNKINLTYLNSPISGYKIMCKRLFLTNSDSFVWLVKINTCMNIIFLNSKLNLHWNKDDENENPPIKIIQILFGIG